MPLVSQFASAHLMADGLGPGGYWAILIMFAAACVTAILFLVGLAVFIVWLIRRRRQGA